MRYLRAIRGASKLVQVCAGVQPGENILIVSDHNKATIAEMIASAALQAGGEVVICIMTPRRIHNEEIPLTVKSAMKSADVIFAPTTFSIAQTTARLEALQAGARVINLPEYTEDMLISGGLEADFEAQRPIVEDVAARLSAANMAELRSPAGTLVALGLEGRKGNASVGMALNRGQRCSPPIIEAAIAPVEGTAQGVLVVDGSIPAPGVGVVREPIRVTITEGRITKVEDGEQAANFRRILESMNDPNAYMIAELGVGLNPCASIVGLMTEDEGAMGTVHLGIGSNFGMGGTIRAALHLDMIVRDATLLLDGVPIMESGTLIH